MGGQGGPVLQISEVVDVDDGDRGLAMLGDRDRTMRIPGLGDQFTQVSPGRRQAVRLVHSIKVYTLHTIPTALWKPETLPPPGRPWLIAGGVCAVMSLCAVVPRVQQYPGAA